MYRSIKIPGKISVGGSLMALAAIAGGIVLSGSAARAAAVANNYADYGHVSNGYTGNNSANPGQNVGGPYCAATSVANSLRFLANKYGGDYASLVPGTTAQARDAIVDLETLDNSNPPTVGKNGQETALRHRCPAARPNPEQQGELHQHPHRSQQDQYRRLHPRRLDPGFCGTEEHLR